MTYKGRCHCRKIAFEVEGDLTEAIECNCSICYESGYLHWILAAVVDTSLGGVRAVGGLERLTIERALPETVVSDNVLGQQSRSPSEQRSPVACGASGFDSAVDPQPLLFTRGRN
jgi:hypothetical protein